MTKKDYLKMAVAHKETDKIPYTVHFTQGAYDKMIAYLNDPDFFSKLGNYIDMFEYHNNTEIKKGFIRDYYGVVWNRSGADKDFGIVDNLLIKDADLSSYTFPTVDEKGLRKLIEEQLATNTDSFKLYCIGFSMFERAWSLCGMENLLINMIVEPEFVEELLDNICEYNMKLINIALEYDIDGIHFGDDWGQQKGLIMGPEHWRKFIKPQMKKMYDKIKSKGKIVSQHSCGDLSDILGDLVDIGLDIYNTVQPEIYDLKSIKKQFGNNLTFWGGISTQKLLPYATSEIVAKTTRETIELMSKGGGYIASPTHAVSADTPIENIIAMMNEFGDGKIL